VGETGVPAPVRRFIASHIVSVAQLEVLLLLRAAADKEWTADEVSRALVTQRDAAAGWLENLRERGLARQEGDRYRYAPSSGELDRTIDSLAESYANYRVAVISLIFARPSERITSLADAFRIRRKG
jgi:DNA-binding IclR family transcriptional regulator